MRDGIRQFLDHPQLWLTIVVAIAICGSFVFVANQFFSIAKNAQDELVNVRVGSLLDAFAPLASEVSDRPDMLRTYMKRMQELNATIVQMDIAEQKDGGWIVQLSSDPQREGEKVYRQDLLLSLASSDPTNSFTVEQVQNGTRYFLTAKSIVDHSGSVRGIVLTKQSLSAADENIRTSLQSAVYVLVAILLAILLLFFKHARIIDYTVLYRKLREVDTLKDEFISMASHELRAPLTSIRGYVEMLRDGTLPSDQAKLSLERVDASAKQLDALIVDMLDVSRIEQGRMSVKPVILDASAALADLAESWRRPAQEKGLALKLDIAPGLSIHADPDRFRQVVVNLLSNAVKYTKAGEVGLSAKAEDGAVAIVVSDTGIGMTEEDREHLFGKFYRAGGEDVRAQAGTGLGLWITKQLIELQGGKISVESIKNVGSRFIARFPRASA